MRSRFALQRSDRLDGLWPVPGEFHRWMLHLQDSYTELYNKSSKQSGTLGNIRTKMNFQGIHPKVSDSFAHNEDLLHLLTLECISTTNTSFQIPKSRWNATTLAALMDAGTIWSASRWRNYQKASSSAPQNASPQQGPLFACVADQMRSFSDVQLRRTAC